MSWLKTCTSRSLAVLCDGCSRGGQCTTKMQAAPAPSARASRRQTTAAETFTPELNTSEQKRMAGNYNGHNDAGGGSKKPKLSPAPSAAPRASKLLNVTTRALKLLMFLAAVSTVVPAACEVEAQREFDAIALEKQAMEMRLKAVEAKLKWAELRLKSSSDSEGAVVKCFLRRLEFKHLRRHDLLYITNSAMAFDLCDDTHSDVEGKIFKRICGTFDHEDHKVRTHSIWRRCFNWVPCGEVAHLARPNVKTLPGVTLNHCFVFTGTADEVGVAYRSCYSCAKCESCTADTPIARTRSTPAVAHRTT